MPVIFLGGSFLPITSYSNTLGTGDRTASITVTDGGSMPSSAGTLNNLVDGGFNANTTDAYSIGGAGTNVPDGAFFRFDFGSGIKKYIDEIKRYIGNTPVSSWGNWKWQVSNDASNWTDVTASIAWDVSQQLQTFVLTNVDAAGFRYYQIIKVGATATAGNSYIEEFEFKIADGF